MLINLSFIQGLRGYRNTYCLSLFKLSNHFLSKNFSFEVFVGREKGNSKAIPRLKKMDYQDFTLLRCIKDEK